MALVVGSCRRKRGTEVPRRRSQGAEKGRQKTQRFASTVQWIVKSNRVNTLRTSPGFNGCNDDVHRNRRARPWPIMISNETPPTSNRTSSRRGLCFLDVNDEEDAPLLARDVRRGRPLRFGTDPAIRPTIAVP